MRWLKTVSMCVPSWNESAALERLILSSLPAAELIREWVVVDHRSTDGTSRSLEALRPLLKAHDIDLQVLHERRDFSRAFTMSDLRNEALAACTSPVAAMMDADFILGSAWSPTLWGAVDELLSRRRRAAAGFSIPVVWDSLDVDEDGRITSHGRVWIHPLSARVMLPGAVRYRQTAGNGKWEKLHYPHPRIRGLVRFDNDGSVLISVNVKPPERIALRETMTFFLEDVKAGRVDGEWLEQYRAGRLRAGLDYMYDSGVSLRGVSLNLQGVSL